MHHALAFAAVIATTALSTVSFSSIVLADATEGGASPINCMQNGGICAATDSTEIEAQNVCIAQAANQVQRQTIPPNTNKDDIQHALYAACYVGYGSGLKQIPPDAVKQACNGAAFTQGKQSFSIDFPALCAANYTAAGGSFSPQGTQTASVCPQKPATFLTMPAWYRGVLDKNCQPSPDAVGGSLSKFIWTIAFNIVEIMLNIVAYTSATFLIVGGFKFFKAGGSCDGLQVAKKTLFNAIIGFIVSLMSIGLVNFIVSRL